jgi:hypothetical protein
MSEPKYRPVGPEENILEGDEFCIGWGEWRKARLLGNRPAMGMLYRRKVRPAQPNSDGVCCSVSLELLKELHDLMGIAIENTVDVRQTHEETLGRTTLKNKRLGEMYDNDLSRLQEAENRLRVIIE